ncbi:MAG TPA: hypothetical protein VHL78_11795 [Actinomycetota bacterium]|nr:hypothetical protein [Actinomycetota bacterium]
MPARRSLLLLTALSLLLLPATASGQGGSSASGSDEAALPTPQLLEAAEARGEITADEATLYLAYAVKAPDRLPPAYRSDVPWDATLPLLRLRESLESMPEGPVRAEIEDVLGVSAADLADPGPGGIGTDFCDILSVAPMPNTIETEHFYIEYNAALVNLGPDGLTIEDYVESLETTFETEVNAFEWAEPPVYTPDPAPNGKYHVRIDEITPVIYGYVSNFGTHAGEVGDNPNTEWEEGDAQASCMVVNTDFYLFPGTPQRALDATTAHEFAHSIQFGLGALTGSNDPDSVFSEGHATWMEDEVFDESNDNYNYLWPRFNDDMGEHEGSPYSYWITWRGMTERYGTTVPGGGEDIPQAFWEILSQTEAVGYEGEPVLGMDAMDLALQTHGWNLPDAYHSYAIAVKFNRPCEGGYEYPYCFQEGPQYVHGDGTQEGAGPTRPHGAIPTVGGSYSGEVPDNYALNWVVLPESDRMYRASLTNTSGGGAFRLSAVCDTGRGFRMRHVPRLIGPGQTGGVVVRTTGCEQTVAVITNLAQTGADPEASQNRTYTLSTEDRTRERPPRS